MLVIQRTKDLGSDMEAFYGQYASSLHKSIEDEKLQESKVAFQSVTSDLEEITWQFQYNTGCPWKYKLIVS